jgi:PAS domain S-box-containing protein
VQVDTLHMRLLHKMALAVLVPVLVGGLVAVMLLRAEWQQGEEVLLRQAEQGLQYRAAALGRRLNEQFATLQVLARSPSLQEGMGEANVELRAWSAASLGFQGVYLLRPDGFAFTADGPLVDLRDRTYVRAVLQGEPARAVPVRSRVDDMPLLVHVAPIRDRDGGAHGGLGAGTPLEPLFEELLPAGGNEAGGARLLMLDAQGQRLAGTLDGPLLALRPFQPGEAPMTEALLAVWRADQGPSQLVRAAGRDWRVFRAPVGNLPLQLLLVHRDDKLLAPVQAARQQGLLLLLATAILLLASSAWMHRMVSERVGQLLGAQERLQQGDLSARLHLSGEDELTALARSFNRMADAIQAADLRFRVMFESLPIPVALSEMEHFHCTALNPAMEEATGLPRAQLLGRNLLDLGIVRGADAIKRQFAGLTAAGRIEGGTAATRSADGRTRWWLYNARVVTLGGRPMALTVITEITMVREARIRLRQSQRMMLRVFHQVPEPLALINADTGVYVEVNQRWEALVGRRRADVVGRDVLSLGLMRDPDQAMAMRRELVATGRVQPQLVAVPLPDGRTLDWEVSCRLITIGGERIGVWVTHDLTDRLAAERTAAHTEQRFRQLFEQSPVALLFADPEGRLRAVNRLWRQLVGHGLDDMATLSDWWALAGAQPEASWRSADPGAAVAPIECHVRCKDGQARVLLLGQSRLDQGLILSAVDVTERRRIEAALQDLASTLEERVQQRTAELQQALDGLRRAQHELVQAEKLASLGALVAGVAHELNTPLGNAVLMASTLDARRQAFEETLAGGLRRSALTAFLDGLRELGVVLDRNLQRAAGLIGSFKQLAVDQTSYQRRKFVLGDVVQEIGLAILPTLRRADVQLVERIEPGIVLDSFPGPLGQVLMNLVNNAVVHAFTPGSGGSVTVATVAVHDGWVHLAVDDNGRGIPADHLDHIFDPFFTTRLGQGGSGLGLHIVYGLVTGLLGGRITAQGAGPQGGARFDIHLPLQAPSDPATVPSEPPPP